MSKFVSRFGASVSNQVGDIVRAEAAKAKGLEVGGVSFEYDDEDKLAAKISFQASVSLPDPLGTDDTVLTGTKIVSIAKMRIDLSDKEEAVKAIAREIGSILEALTQNAGVTISEALAMCGGD